MSRSRSQTENRMAGAAFVVAALVLTCGLSITFGARDVALSDIVNALRGQTDTIAQAAVASRIPRTLLALLAGAALGLSGAVMQGLTRNPLADPGILGVNAGAALAVVIGIAWFGIDTAHVYIWSAIVGAMLTALFVYAIASVGQAGPPLSNSRSQERPARRHWPRSPPLLSCRAAIFRG